MIRNSCDSIILGNQHPKTAITIIVQVVNDSDEVSVFLRDFYYKSRAKLGSIARQHINIHPV